MKLLLLTSLIAVNTAFALGQSTVAAINTYVRGVERHTASKRNPKFVFADTSDYAVADSKAKWRKFASEKALEKHREGSDAYTIAFSWSRAGRVVGVNFTLSSPSGDWAKYVYHFFRPDGTLAKAEVDYRTFHGDFIVEQDLYYSPAGKLLKKTTRYKDLQTGKPKKPEDGYLSDNSEMLAGDIYKSVAKLPFARLIKK